MTKDLFENEQIMPIILSQHPLGKVAKVDVSDWDKTNTAVKQIGVVDLFVNNAGILHQEEFVDLKIINTNFKSAFNITQIVAHGLISAGRPGAVVNVSSVGGLKAAPRSMSYCVSKAMMDMLTKVTALELSPYNIRVNSVNPTGIYTDMTKHLFENEQIMPIILSQHPLGKVAKVEDKGAKVYVVRRAKENLEKLKVENPSFNTIQVDVSDWDQTKTSVEQIGVVDLLGNNAGILHQENFFDLGIEKLEEIINTNF
ncbi:hypothetical protein KUTeg_022261 [Tegillarca granosa]|uniref:Uncharacterized protein n=1 Tax=Tegillarca granosa TaxID=220873 RepID=A0ABQ9E631_TEGGR|nr:hypothetical protein KUTeg_022261 [Tegillarca granosa]